MKQFLLPVACAAMGLLFATVAFAQGPPPVDN
jgi:hypothetical protein